jgi:hypothetical protein
VIILTSVLVNLYYMFVLCFAGSKAASGGPIARELKMKRYCVGGCLQVGNVYPVIELPNDAGNKSLKGRPQVVAAIFIMSALQRLSHKEWDTGST